MSGYHGECEHGRVEGKARARRVRVSREVTVSLEGMRQRAKGRLLALCGSGAGREDWRKDKHSTGRLGFRRGYEARRVTLGGRKVKANRP